MKLAHHHKDTLVIEVDYNEWENSVDAILSVHAYSPKTRKMVDILEVFMTDLEGEKLINRLDWREIYYYQKNAKEFACD